MVDELNKGLVQYNEAWRELLQTRGDKQFFEQLKPVAVGWKVADPAQYERWRLELHSRSSQIIETWMNGRWIAKCLLREPLDGSAISIIKIMQRRPTSKDAVGLDHVDFYTDREPTAIEAVLRAEKDLQWTAESNDIIDAYEWLSIWFAGTEAKLKNYTVLGTVKTELDLAEQSILRPKR